MKPLTLGIISEALLAAGIACLVLGISAALGHIEPALCVPPIPIYGCLSYARYFGLAFLLALPLLVASAVGFVYTIRSYEETLAT